MSAEKIVEIDAIAVEEWDSEQHTPVHAESNLAELVKKSGLDAGWDTATTKEEPVVVDKPRTTTNTMRRTGAAPAMPSKVHKTMALPTVAVKPAAVAQKPEAKPAAKSPTKTTATGVTPVVAAATPATPAKPAAKSPTKTTATGVTPVVAAAPAKSPTKTTATGVTPVVAAAPVAAPAKPATPPKSPTKTTATGVAPVVAAAPTFSPFGNEPAPARTEATPAPKAARTDATPPPKPVRADATPAKPAVAAKPVEPVPAAPTPAKPVRTDATPAPVAAKPAAPTPEAKPVRADATPAKPSRVPDVLSKPAGEAIAARLAAVEAPARAPSALELPAWPPVPVAAKRDFEDWDELGGATSVGTQERPQPPRAPGEDSVIVDLNAEPKTEKPKLARAQSAPITSEQGTATSGAFVMPTVAQPIAAQVAPAISPVISTERPTSPALPIAARSEKPTSPAMPAGLVEASNAASAWHTPLPLAAPPPEPAPQWPSAAGLDYGRAQGSAPEIPVPARHEPTEPRIDRRSLLASVFPTPKSRKRGLLIAAGAFAAILVVVLFATGGSAKATTEPTVATAKRATPAESPASPAMPAPATPTTTAAAAATVATSEPAAAPTPTPTTNPPAKKPIVAKRRISRGKKPVVVDYDKKPDPTPEQDEALTRARADYAAGNRHLFAGETAAAIVSYRQALAAYPNYVAGYRGLGLAFAQQGNKGSAVDAFKIYVKLAPTAKDVALIEKRIRSLSVR